MHAHRFISSALLICAIASSAAVASRPPLPVIGVVTGYCVMLGGDAAPPTVAEIDAAMLDRAYPAAIEKIDAVLAGGAKELREELLYRRGLALLYQSKFEEARGQFEAVATEFPKGLWAAKAKFRQADCHTALKQFDAAERIYAAAVTELVGDARRSRIGQLYLDFASEYFEPKDSFTRPDFAKARQFYQRAIEFDPGEAVREVAMSRRVACSVKLGEWQPAAVQAREYLTLFDPEYRETLKSRSVAAALPAAANEPGKSRVRVRALLSEALFGANDWPTARRELQDLIALLDKLDPERKQHRGVWAQAQIDIARTYGVPTPNDAATATLGIAALQQVLTACPETRQAVIAQAWLGHTNAHLGRTDDAIAAFRELIDRTRIKPEGDEAKSLADSSGQDTVYSVAELLFKQGKYADAIGMWNQYVAKYPNGPKWSAAQQAIIGAEYQIGRDAFDKKKYDEAKTAWTAFLEKYPLDGRAPQTLYDLGEIALAQQIKREEGKQQPDWNEPIAQYRRLVNKYPNTEESGRAQWRIGQILEERAKDLEAAFAEYSKLTWSQAAAAAQQRIAEMKATRLALLVERTWRTNEPAKIRVDTRNVDALTVKLYRIDMEDYFRKSHSVGGVERLDLALIDPDKSIEVPVKEFGKYKPVTQIVELPIDGAGVYAVTVSNEQSKLAGTQGIDHVKLESTAMVIRSDIDIIVKTSRRQVLIYAQNMLDQTPAADVQLVLSDGGKTLVTGKTGADGVWTSKLDELKNVGGLSVLARSGEQFAGTGLGLDGLSFSSGLAPRGYIYTDRPAYRPGDAVNIHGILRETKDGQYALPTQPEDALLRWKLDVVDPQGRVLSTVSPAIGEFGTVAAQFQVSLDAPLGEYKLIARRANGPTFAGSFVVAKYELAKAYLTFDLPERVLLRGEKLKGSIVAKYHYGEPVVGKTVAYSFATPSGDVINRVGVTDKEGKIAIEFDTAAVPEECTVTLSATQAELSLNNVTPVTVAVRAFRAEVTTPQTIYLSDQPVEASVKTSDLKGGPIGQEMTITALLRTQSGGTWTETKVDQQTVKTDAKTGSGRATFKLTKGGTYVLRTDGKDRFGHTVSAERAVQVSGDDDETKLRIFSDRETYKVGETVALDIHSRIEQGGATLAGRPGRRALLTFEGEEVIGYRTIWVEPGHNKLDLPIGHEHFPNFAVSLAVMAGDKFHTAQRDLQVERQLQISIKPSAVTFRPRDEMTVDVLVTDQRGQPVKTAIGMTMIDQSLLDQYADSTPGIVPFFQEGARRVAGLRACSSCTYRQATSARAMQTEVLKEIARLEDAEKDKLASLAMDLQPGGDVGATALRVAPSAGALELKDAERRQLEAVGYVGDDADAASGSTRPGDAKQVRRMAANAAPGKPSGGRAGGGGSRGAAGAVAAVAAPALRGVQTGQPASTQNEADFSSTHFTFDQQATEGLAEWTGSEIKVETLGRESVNQALNKQRGEYGVYFGLPFTESDERQNALIRQAPPGTVYPEVAYWNPTIVTDDAGKATLKIVLPDSTTRWKLMARGVTVQTLVGDATAEVVTRQDFFAELLTPAVLVQGDTARALMRVHSLCGYKGEVDVTLSIDAATWPTKPAAQSQRVKLDGDGVVDVEFEPFKAETGGTIRVTAQATTASDVESAKRKLSAADTREIAIRPWGMRLEENTAGIGRDTDFVEIDLPKAPAGGGFVQRQLTVAVGSSMPRWLIDEALESGPRWAKIDSSLRCLRIVPPRTHADTAATLVGCLYAADYARAHGDKADGKAQSGDLAVLNDRIAALVAQLVSAQREDGGWAWSGTTQGSDPWSTSYVAWALGKARADKVSVADATAQKATAFLQKAFADARPEQTELKAVALFGLSWLGDVDFGHANRLYRNRQQLSNAALAHLAVVFCNLDRKPIAIELLGELERRMQDTRGRGTAQNQAGKRVPSDGCSAWMTSDLEITALTLLAQLRADAKAQSVQPMVNYLTAAARAEGWNPHKARGPVLAALCTWFGGAQSERAAYKLAVSVNGKERATVTPDDAGCVRIDLGEADLAAGKQRVDFAFSGRGEYAYAVTYSGFASEFPKPIRNQNEPVWMEVRWYAPPPLEYKGRPINAGFGITSWRNWFINRMAEIAQGKVVQVQVNFGRHDHSRNAAGDADYLVLQETIPAGFRLLTNTIESNHLAYDYSDNVLTLYYGSQWNIGNLRYQIVATTPGEYRVPPTVLRSLYKPDRYNLNTADTIKVLPRDGTSKDPYRLTPDELYSLAQFHFNDGDFDATNRFLTELLAGKDWTLNDDVYRETVRMLLTSALARKQADDVVNYFEIMKEKYPDLLVPFEQMMQVAAAYGSTKQHERAWLIYRAIADTAFSEDVAVAGVLQQQGKFFAGIDFLQSLWREYPDTPQVESTYFAMSQQVYGQSDTAANLTPRKAADGAAVKRVTRGDVIRESIALLERFLALYPESAIADEAAYSLANAYLDLDQFDAALAKADRFAKRFAGSKWLDRFRYIEALAQFNLGKFEQARELADQVAKATFKDEQGVERPSPNRSLALYIIGQIYHAQGDKAKALEFYKKVKEQFSDAAEAIGYFENKFVKLPELTIFHPDGAGFRESSEWERQLKRARVDGGAATPAATTAAGDGERGGERGQTVLVAAQDRGASGGGGQQAGGKVAGSGDAPLYERPFIELAHRNIKSAVVQVYRVDLMKLMLMQRNPAAITRVNLAGVHPLIEKTVELGNGLDYVDRATRIDLEGVARAAAAAEKEKQGGKDAGAAGASDSTGAYLVICRGEDMLASGLVLVTPLTLDVQSEPGAGRARVNVASAIDRGGVKSVHVKVMGLGMNQFISGETDLRGVYVADGVSRYPMAIARDDAGHVCLYRSEEALLAMAMPRTEEPGQPGQAGEKADYRKNLQLENRAMQGLNDRKLQEMYKVPQKRAVQVQQAK